VRSIARVQPGQAARLIQRRQWVAQAGAGVTIAIGIAGMLSYREMAHYRYRAQLARPERVDGFEGGDPRSLVASNGGVCAIMANNTVRCFGNNATRFLGLGYVQRHDAAPLPGLSQITQLSLGFQHACSLHSSDGGVPRCWGGNASGQLGDGTRELRQTPVLVRGLDNVTELALGATFTLARRSDGTVWRWGEEAGIENHVEREATTRVVPGRIEALEHVEAIAAVDDRACAIHSGGEVLCWGTIVEQPSGASSHGGPVRIGVPAARAIRVSQRTAYALSKDGSVWSWGFRADPDDEGETSEHVPDYGPRKMDRLTGAVDIAAGMNFACALMPDGTVPCWGNDEHGALGDGVRSFTYRRGRADVTGVTSIAAGERGVCARKSDRTVWCWGWL